MNFDTKIWELHLGKIKKIDKWIDYGIGGRRVCPRVPPGLPIWKELPLDRKLPFLTPPVQDVFLSRGYPAEKLLSGKPANDFRLWDALGHELHTSYEQLHDKHLKNHFRKSTVVEHLQKIGQINDKNEAKSCLKKLNKFRGMTRLMNLDEIKLQMKMENDAIADERRLQRIEENFKETQHYWEMQEKFKKLREKNQKEILQARQEKIENWKAKILKNETKVENLQNIQNQKIQNLKRKRIGKEEKMKMIQENIFLNEKSQILKLKRKIRERDIKLKKMMNVKNVLENEQRLEKVKEKWEIKCAEMMRSKRIKEEIANEVLQQFEENVEKRKERAAKVKAQQALKSKRILMRKTLKHEKDPFEKIKQDDESVVDYMINYLIDLSLKEWIKQIIRPQLSIASRITNEYGFYLLNKLRMERSKIKSKTEENSSHYTRKQTIVSLLSLETFSYKRSSVEQNFKKSFEQFIEKEKLEHNCNESIKRLLSYAKSIVSEGIEPTTRLQTIKNLTKYEYRQEKLTEILATAIFYQDLEGEALVAAGLARIAITSILNPPEWLKPESELTKIRRLLSPP